MGADVNKIHLEASATLAELKHDGKIKESSPERSLGSNAEVLQDEPNSHVIIRIGELERADAKTANEIPCKHATGRRARVNGNGSHVLRGEQWALVLLHVRGIIPGRSDWGGR